LSNNAGEEHHKMSQEKISVPKVEWQLIVKYFEEHPEEMMTKGIRSPTMLLRQWMLEKYRENISRESTQ
jgi:hypothetical protein